MSSFTPVPAARMPRRTAAPSALTRLVRTVLRTVLPAVLCGAVGWLLAAAPAPAVQEGGRDGEQPPAAERQEEKQEEKQEANGDAADKAAGPAPYTRQLPAGYGAVGLSREQKETVYAIQAKYAGRIDELLEQVADLKQEEAEEIRTVLTPGQLEFLKAWKAKKKAEREAEAKKKAAKDAAK